MRVNAGEAAKARQFKRLVIACPTTSTADDRVSAFSEQLWNLPAGLSESLLHGAVCGLLCGAPEESFAGQRRALTDLLDDASRMDEDELDRFIEFAADELASPELAFEPLLPGDEFAMGERIESLAEWCDGFLTAFDETGGELDDDAADALEDIERIAEVDGNDEDDEFDLFSVAEHLKVAVLLIHDSAHAPQEPDDDESE
jgi:uncharacterized protein YgfB (UPF0149 family)